MPRDSRRIDTWHKSPASAGAAPTMSSFVFAVPKGAPASEQEGRLRAAAAPVYARYAANKKKHGVAFEEASTVFGNPVAWFQPDAAPSLGEDRLLLSGRSSGY